MPDANDTDRDVIVSWFGTFEEDGDEELARFLVHCGVDVDAAPELDNAIAAHYRLPNGAYDVDRAANDLATYPPVAARIEELMAEKAKTETDGGEPADADCGSDLQPTDVDSIKPGGGRA